MALFLQFGTLPYLQTRSKPWQPTCPDIASRGSNAPWHTCCASIADPTTAPNNNYALLVGKCWSTPTADCKNALSARANRRAAPVRTTAMHRHSGTLSAWSCDLPGHVCYGITPCWPYGIFGTAKSSRSCAGPKPTTPMISCPLNSRGITP